MRNTFYSKSLVHILTDPDCQQLCVNVWACQNMSKRFGIKSIRLRVPLPLLMFDLYPCLLWTFIAGFIFHFSASCSFNSDCVHGECNGLGVCSCSPGWCFNQAQVCALPKNSNGIGVCPTLTTVQCPVGLMFVGGFGCGGVFVFRVDIWARRFGVYPNLFSLQISTSAWFLREVVRTCVPIRTVHFTVRVAQGEHLQLTVRIARARLSHPWPPRTNAWELTEGCAVMAANFLKAPALFRAHNL
jgi:hypothetical protein